MTKEDFLNESFGYPKKGEAGFLSGSIYGEEHKDIDHRLFHIRRCFDYDIWEGGKRVLLSFESSKNIFVVLWKKAKDLEDFKKLIKFDKDSRFKQLTGELLKDDREYLKSFVNPENCFETSSEVGGIKIGVENFTILAPNDYGDTNKNIVSINDKDTLNTTSFKYWTTIEGKEINIYSYDCGNEVATTISGRYGIYYKDRIVIFERWEEN